MKIVPPVLVALATIGVMATGAGIPIGSALAQLPPTATLNGIFEPDLAEVLDPGQLKAAADKAKGDGKWKGDQECYPPSGLRAKFTSVIKQEGDPLFLETLGNARGEAITAALKNAGVDSGRFSTAWEYGGDESVRVTYEEFVDADPPVFRELHSDPEKGTRVKAGDKIKVTVVASERYIDGHMSWPTGVQLIQLVADDGLVDSKAFPKPPSPCERAEFEATYPVPDHPPMIVHLHVIAEDGVGNKKEETGDFPTVSGFKFSGVRFDWRSVNAAHVHDDISGEVCGNPFKEPWRVTWTVTNALNPSNSGSVSVAVPISGAGIDSPGEGDYGRYLHFTFISGPPAQMKVSRHDGQWFSPDATVPLVEDKSCDVSGVGK